MRYVTVLLGIAYLAMLHLVTALSYTIPLKPLIRGATNDEVRKGLGKIWSLYKRADPLETPLIDWLGGSDYQWYSTISIGTPPQNLTVLWNTGFSDLVIPRNNCTTCGTTHRTFDPTSSSTFAEAEYGDVFLSFLRSENSTPLASPELAHCNLVYDRVAIGGLAQSSQAIVLCDEYTPSLASMPIDGIIGLAPYGTSGTGERPFFWNLWKTHQLNYPVFSLYLPAREESGAQITLGDVDTTKYVGPITTLSLDPRHYSEWGTWVHHFNGIHVNGQRLPRSLSGNLESQEPPFTEAAAILDTSAAFIQVPDYATARDLYGSLSSEIKPIDTAGAAGNVYINVTLPQTAFNLGEYPGQPGICQAVFVHNAYHDDFGPYWVLGSPLLKTYYTVWDGLKLEVGWAELA
ncbi:acid protease [Xylaria intraflava]|nr:acid protease [Xylaria intraflava]